VPDGNSQAYTYTNPFDVPRKELLSHIVRMRVNFLKLSTAGNRLQDKESMHSASVQDMGNYQEYLKKQPPPLREIETLPVRQHTFGNPFKVNKNIMIDEADEAMPGQSPGRKRPAADTSSHRLSKRKPGPLPRDVPARRLMSPIYESRPLSPAPSSLFDQPVYSAVVAADSTDDEDTREDSDESLQNDAQRTNHVGDAVEGLSNHLNNNVYSDMNGDLGIDLGAQGNQSNGDVNGLPRNQHHEPNDGVSTQALDHNAALLRLAIKEVKRPGKNYTRIFDHLRGLHGSIELRSTSTRKVITEALRFKKQMLAALLEDFITEQTTVAKSEPSSDRRYSDSNNALAQHHISLKYNIDEEMLDSV
jgi:integrator complex subunit 6